MTIHYHGTPITPKAVMQALAGRCFCVSFWRPDQAAEAHAIGQSVMLDNGAFSAWRSGKPIDDWSPFYAWAERWLDYRTSWAVIPDVIDGDEADNDALVDQWPFGNRGAPVWHMHESIGRLLRLAERFGRVCIGSSGAFAVVGTDRWHGRMITAMNDLCGDGPTPVWLHMLRGMKLAGDIYPFASVDSTAIARNHAGNNTRGGAAKDVREMADRFDAMQCPALWRVRAFQPELGDASPRKPTDQTPTPLAHQENHIANNVS